MELNATLFAEPAAPADLEEQFGESTEEQEREAFLQTLDTFPVAEDLDDPVNTDVALDHYLEQLSQREADIAANHAVAEHRRAMIEGWEREQNGRLERECQWLRQQIEAWGRQYDFGSRKSRALPNGSFGFRATPAKVEITDMEAAVAFAEREGLEVKKTVGKKPLMAYIKAHQGVIPDGCEYVDGADVFFVKTGAGR